MLVPARDLDTPQPSDSPVSGNCRGRLQTSPGHHHDQRQPSRVARPKGSPKIIRVPHTLDTTGNVSECSHFSSSVRAVL